MSNSRTSTARLRAAAALQVELWCESGVERLPAAPRDGAAAPARDSEGGAAAEAEAGTALAALAGTIAGCRKCRLCETRTHTVPGEGAPRARVLFVGEAPGADEDASGRPFVGRAGQLLTKIIESGMGLARGEVFIANVLKCRPPGNRDPQVDEKEACSPYLEAQIAAIEPELVVALGRHAACHLLGVHESLGRLRGRLHRRTSGPPVLVTYHPAYLLRNASAKKDCWEDIQIAMELLDLPLPGARPAR